MNYIVTFNSEEYGVGAEQEMPSVDYIGKDKDKVIARVLADAVEEEYPLVFVKWDCEEDNIEGVFRPADDDEDDYSIAVLFADIYCDIPQTIVVE